MVAYFPMVSNIVSGTGPRLPLEWAFKLKPNCGEMKEEYRFHPLSS